ncbi:uncharacterized protein LOC142353290 [Convolutriloba macropyga]|uniref:uncharacterized protein LOC142353290 n=1 Tax=Convolutriloba macropyga TaxID=536237 RepID=UPI003F522E11
MGTPLVASGMGSLLRGSVYNPNQLRQISLTEVPHLMTSTDPEDSQTECPEGNICTLSNRLGGGLGKYDDGGPLYAESNVFGCNFICLYGVASYSMIDQKNTQIYANIFASIPDHRIWIMSILN